MYLLCPALGELSGQVPTDAASSPGNEHHIPGQISAFARDEDARECFDGAAEDLQGQKQQRGAQRPQSHVGASACGAMRRANVCKLTHTKEFVGSL